MQLYLLRIFSAIAIALIYMLYDVFNRRNVPSVFAYATLAYGFVLTILYFNLKTISVSISASLVILGIGYVIYRIGQLGAADVIEFAAISLVIPLQRFPVILASASQLGMPFALSLAINTGIIAMIVVPLYYIPKAAKVLGRPVTSFITMKNALMALLSAVAYLAFMLFITSIIGTSYTGIILLSVILVGSFFVMLFSMPIQLSMIRPVEISQLEEGDIIAFNLMDSRKIRAMEKKIRGFGRLVTDDVARQAKKLKLKAKLPVYKDAMPFAVPIFLATVTSVLVGNLILLII